MVEEAPGRENTNSSWGGGGGTKGEKVSGDRRPGMLKRPFHPAELSLGRAFLVEGSVRTEVWRQGRRGLVWSGWNASCVWSMAGDETVKGRPGCKRPL